MNTIILSGLRADSISGYFSALAVLRLVTQQKDPTICGRFTSQGFEVETELTQEELVRFFHEEYVPTPIFSPWNKASGFWEDDSKEDTLSLIQKQTDPRFDCAKRVISEIQELARNIQFNAREDGCDKAGWCLHLRSFGDDSFLEWVDVVSVARTIEDGFLPSSIMWSGGNEGRTEFSKLFWGGILEVTKIREGVGTLFFEETSSITTDSPGSFLLSSTGGYNRDRGEDAENLLNPWEYILSIEGMILMQSNLSKRSGKRAGVSPFMTRNADFGYATSSYGEKGKGEFWAPVWSEFSSLGEIRKLFSEGRVQAKREEANDSFSFSQSLSGLGVDRRIEHFNRWGFFVRKGDQCVTSFLGRWDTHRNKQCDPLSDIVAWVNSVAWRVGAKSPATHRKARALLEKRLFNAIQSKDPHDILLTLESIFQFRRVLSTSFGPSLSSDSWESMVRQDTPEYRLAASFASLKGLDLSKWKYGLGLQGNLIEILHRWEISDFERLTSRFCSAHDVQKFLDGELDEKTLESYILGLSTLAWHKPLEEGFPKEYGVNSGVSRIYLALKLAMDIEPNRKIRLTRLLASGKQDQALQVARRRLAAKRIRLFQVPEVSLDQNRLAASLAFTTDTEQIKYLANQESN